MTEEEVNQSENATDPENETPIGDVAPEGVETLPEGEEEPAAAEAVEEDPSLEVEKWRALALRGQADLENYRKRMAREKSEAIQYANASLLSSLLPVLDNFEMGLLAAQQEGEGNIIYQGFVMVRKQIEDFLVENGVKPVPSTGPFDPNQHEAVKQEPHDSIPEGEIIAELRRGYRLSDRLLRAANVIVSTGPGEGAA